jgi:hypothetical protein
MMVGLALPSECIPADPPQQVQEVPLLRMTVGRGSFAMPSGPWKAEAAADGNSIELGRERSYKVGLIAPKYDGTVYVRVFFDKVLEGEAPLDEEATASDFFDQELQIMRDELKPSKLGAYGLDKIRRGTTSIGGKSLYFMRYHLTTWTWTQPSVLYLWFPPDFAETRQFYGFLSSERVPLEATRAVTLADIEPIIEGFRLE